METKASPHAESTQPTSVFAPKQNTSTSSQTTAYIPKIVATNYSKRENTTPTQVFKK